MSKSCLDGDFIPWSTPCPILLPDRSREVTEESRGLPWKPNLVRTGFKSASLNDFFSDWVLGVCFIVLFKLSAAVGLIKVISFLKVCAFTFLFGVFVRSFAANALNIAMALEPPGCSGEQSSTPDEVGVYCFAFLGSEFIKLPVSFGVMLLKASILEVSSL